MEKVVQKPQNEAPFRGREASLGLKKKVSGFRRKENLVVFGVKFPIKNSKTSVNFLG